MTSEPPGAARDVPAPATAGPAPSGPVVEPLLDDLLTDAVPGMPIRSGTGVGAPARPGAEPAAHAAQAAEPAAEAARAAEAAVARALGQHRDHRGAWYGDLVGALRVPASAVPAVLRSTRPVDHELALVLIADPSSKDPVADLRAARSLLLDNHRVKLVGVELPFATGPGRPAGDLTAARAQAARRALDELDFSVPAWFMAPAEPGWEPAFDVLAQDGAESVGLFLPPPAGADVIAGVASALRALIDRELPFAISSGVSELASDDHGYGLLNLLAATRAALAAASAGQLAAILAETDPEPLAAAARQIGAADAGIVRAFLPAVSCRSIRGMVSALLAADLIEPDAA